MQKVRLRLLGPLQLEECDTGALDRRQVRTLLKVLALGRGQPVPVDRLIDCLWRDRPPARATQQISVLASRLRGVLGADRVLRSDAGYVLVVDWLDLDALDEYLSEAERRLVSGTPAAARTAAAAGLHLFRGPLLADEADAWWATTEQAATERIRSRLHRIVAGAALAGGEWSEAGDLALAMLASDPYDEPALRLAMEALARSGRQASALSAYATVRARLAEDLGTSPSEETETLHTAILVGELPASAGSPAPGGPLPVDLPGRTGIIGSLDALVDLARTGRGQFGVLGGEAGIGKSRLLQLWTDRLAGRGTAVVSVSCDELGRALPLQPVLDAVEALLRRADETVDVLGPDAAVLGPLLGRSSGPRGDARLVMLTDPGAGLALVFAALFAVLRRQAELEPLVLVVDDVHLADAATVAWLGQSARRLADSRVTIVAGQRTEEGVNFPGATTLALGPLTLADTEALVGPDRAGTLHARSGGHPLFLVELAAADDGDALPATIKEAVAERCARAGPAAATLRAAAVMGPAIDLDLLAAVTATPPSTLLDHLEEGVRRRFLVEEGQAFVFAHALIREAMVSTVSAARAAFLHRQAGRALGARPHVDPLVVAHHARLGGDLEFASAMLVDAARLAVARFDQDEAMRLLDEAVSLDDTVDARLERARVASMTSQHTLAGDDLEAARRAGAGPEALEIAAWSAHYQRHFEEALTLADRGAGEADDPDLRAGCLALGGWVSLASGDLHGAEVRLVGALGSATEVGGGMAEAWLAWLRMNQGRPLETLRLVRPQTGRGLAAYRFPNAYGGMVATMALVMLGRVDEAMATLDTLEADVDAMHARRWAPRPLNLRGWIVRNLGALDEADELNQAAIEAARQERLDEPLANGLLDLAAGRLLAGDADAADSLLGEAMPFTTIEHAFRWRHQLRGRLLRATLDRETGNFEAARAGATSLAADAATLGTPRYEVQALLLAAMAARQQGTAPDHEAVGRLLQRLDEVAGLEGWRITAEVAGVFEVPAWRELAARRVQSLQRHAGRYADALGRAASRYL